MTADAEDDRYVYCGLCGWRFETEDELDDHMAEEHDED